MCRTRRSAVVGGLLTAVLVPLFVQPFVTSTMGQWAAETPSIGSPEVPPAGASLDAQIEAAPATQDGGGVATRASGDGLACRAAPSAEAAVLAVLTAGDPMLPAGEPVGAWQRVDCGGVVGYVPVADDTVREVEPSPAAWTPFWDGFESGDLSSWTVVSGVVVQGEEVAAGAYAARGRGGGGSAFAARALAASQPELHARVKFKLLGGVGALVPLLELRTAAYTPILGIHVDEAGRLGIGTTPGATATAVAPEIWHEVEVRVRVGVGSGPGEVEVWYDGHWLEELSSVQDLGTEPIGLLVLGAAEAVDPSYDVAFDDVAVDIAFVTPEIVAPLAGAPAAAESGAAEPGMVELPLAGEPLVPVASVADTEGVGANCRAAPSAEAAVLAVLPEGAAVTPLGAPVGAWQLVDCGGSVGGYVDRDYLAYAAGAAPSVAPPTATPPTATSAPTTTSTPTTKPTTTAAATSTPELIAAAAEGETLTFAPVADARVEEASPTANFGASTTLRADGGVGTHVRSYLRFDVRGVAGAVAGAKLRLFVRSSTADGPAVFTAGSTWSEAGITWNNRPGRTSGARDDKGAITASTWVEYDVTPFVTADGTYTLVLAGESTDEVDFIAREYPAYRPQLVLTIGGSGAPASPSPAPSPSPSATPSPSPSSSPESSKLTIVGSGRSSNSNSSTYAYDGNTSTSWYTTSWVTPSSAFAWVDLGTAKALSSVRWMFGRTGSADAWRIEVSNDRSTWTPISSTLSNAPSANTWQSLSVSASARYVQFYFTNPNRDARLGYLSEVELYGAGSPSSSPTPSPTPSGPPVALGAYIWGAREDPTQIDSFANLIGRMPATVMWYQQWGGPNSAFNRPLIESVASRGAMPMISWMPTGDVEGVDDPASKLSSIVRGDFDTYITSWATGLAAYGEPVYLRFAHEMNGDWYSYCAGVNGNTAADFVAAWRHVHDLFVAAGATNVRWVWSPNVENSASTPTPMADLYPGDAYVDWVGLDGYNWGGAGWRTFAQVFGPSYQTLLSITSKPMMIAEVASAEEGGDKAAWILDTYQTQLSIYFPAVRAIVWFHENKERDWRVHSSQASLGAFRTAAADPYLQGELS